MKKVVIGAIVAAVVINLTIGLILYQKKVIFQPTPTYQPVPTPTGVFVPKPKTIGSYTVVRGAKPIFAGDLLNLAAGSQSKLTLNGVGTANVSDGIGLRIQDASHLQINLGRAAFNLSANLSLEAYSSQLQAMPGTFTIYVQPSDVKIYVQTGGVSFKDGTGQMVTIQPNEEAEITPTEVKVSSAPSTPSWVLL